MDDVASGDNVQIPGGVNLQSAVVQHPGRCPRHRSAIRQFDGYLAPNREAFQAVGSNDVAAGRERSETPAQFVAQCRQCFYVRALSTSLGAFY